jgi:hypothetical protein
VPQLIKSVNSANIKYLSAAYHYEKIANSEAFEGFVLVQRHEKIKNECQNYEIFVIKYEAWKMNLVQNIKKHDPRES